MAMTMQGTKHLTAVGIMAFALGLGGLREAYGADLLSITASPTSAVPGTVITFRISPVVISESDVVNFDFGDGGQGSIAFSIGCTIIGGCSTIQHAYAGVGSFTVNGSGTINNRAVSGTVSVTVTAPPAEADLYVATSAHVPGYVGTNWRTDLDINNQGTTVATYEISVLLRDQDNSTPMAATHTLAPRQSAHFGDILQTEFGLSNAAAALRIKEVSGTIMITSRTYNQLVSGTFGQSVPAIALADAIPYARSARIIGLSHDPSGVTGYRTNIGFVNATPAPITIQVNFYSISGVLLAINNYNLLAYELVQRDKIFELDGVTSSAIEFAFVEIRTTTVGGAFFAYASVVDNVTGDPTYVAAQLVDVSN